MTYANKVVIKLAAEHIHKGGCLMGVRQLFLY